MEAENMVHSDSMSPASLGICEKLFRRWELKTSLTEGSARRSQQTLTIRLGLPDRGGRSSRSRPSRYHCRFTHMSALKSPSRTMESPVRSTIKYPSQGLQEGRVLCTAVRPVGTNNSKRPIPNPKAQGSDLSRSPG
ncbi:hypothetical protein L3Q82_014001 [Scortum barcoo]|uniref:Uncharacterized protein n=1 Tax=Scortum barcoo TaxID=214431 RepID=A0ACB8VW29_9TELE|nr:hypothetical protein L3Q82_014001 [Scortum barcoo]